MPNIRQYTAQESVHADGTQAAAAASAASSIREGFSSVASSVGGAIRNLGGQVEQANANAETSKLAADLATTQAQLTVEWERIKQTADPNDHELSSRFIEERVNPALASIGENLSTQAGRDLYERSGAGIRAHMFVTTSADQSTLAGEAAVRNANTVLNETSATATNDPAGLPNYLAMYDSALEGMTGLNGLSTTEREKQRQSGHAQIALASFQGAAQRNPEAALERLAAGDYNQYANGTKQMQMRAYAEQVQRNNAVQARADQAETVRAQKAQADGIANQITASTIAPDGSMHVGPDYFKNVHDLALMPGVDPSLPRAMRSAGIALSKADVATSDPATYLDMLDRVGKGQLTMQEIFQARGAGQLTNKDFSFMLQWQKELASNPERRTQQQTFNAFLAGMKAFITKSNMLIADADGNQRYSEYARDMSARYWDGLAHGRKPEEMFNEFRTQVPQYQVPMGTSTGRMSNVTTPNAPLPRAPVASVTEAAARVIQERSVPQRAKNESAADYLRRTAGARSAPVVPPTVPGSAPVDAADDTGDTETLDEDLGEGEEE